MEEKINVLSEALIKYTMLHTENERAKACEKTHIPYLDISVTDKENRVHAISFYRKDLRYSSAQHDNVYNYYFKCESPLLSVNMECWHPEIDWERYNITSYRCQNLTIYCRAAEKPSGWAEELRSVRFTKNYAEHIEYYWASWIGEAVAWVENSSGEVTSGHRDAPPGIQTKSSTIAVGVENIVWGYTGA